MINMARWQRMVYGLGEAALAGGLIWAFVRMLVLHACPVSIFNDLTLIVIGLVLITIPLYPMGPALYLRPWLRRTAAGYAWWVVALATLAYALSVRLSTPVGPDQWWVAALAPAMLYFMLALETQRREDLPPQAPPAPPQEGRDG
jgi:hypothetical protein